MLTAVFLFYRKIRYGYAFRRIHLSPRKSAIVDAEDYSRLSQYEWFIVKEYCSYYAVRFVWDQKSKKDKSKYMHHEIRKPRDGKIIDHINNNGLDNRRANLRLATHAQNRYNRKKSFKPSSSMYKGVYWKKKVGKWSAQIGHNGQRKYLGCFEDEADAAKAYDRAAKIYHGEFASLNFERQHIPWLRISKVGNIPAVIWSFKKRLVRHHKFV